MAWDDGLLPDQRSAACHVGAHARLLAGPGTGKTRCLTSRICFLVEERGVEPSGVLALTFTRAAAHELRSRVSSELNEDSIPTISTLHAFALRQLLRNADRLQPLPLPLRIADDWEERNIVLEDLKSLLRLPRVEDARDLLNRLSADWQSLTAEEADWEARFPNPQFLGAWQEHREIYGYTLRSELVYQLKRALERTPEIELEGPPAHLLVDEYQDLNRCDLAVVRAVADRGAELFVAGDDDQSIYGFRKAHPEGIRRFPQDYRPAAELPLEICKRCDEEILDLGLFVARQDYNRLDKPLRADEGRRGGQVAILRFRDQAQEAHAVSLLCRHLIEDEGLEPHDILVLLRTDRNRAFSSLLRDALTDSGVPVSVTTTESSALGEIGGRQVLAVTRLLVNENDHLAWRTLLELRTNGIGVIGIESVRSLASQRGIRFAHAVRAIRDDPSLISAPHGRRVRNEAIAVEALLAGLQPQEDEPLVDVLDRVVTGVLADVEDREPVLKELREVTEVSDSSSLADVVRGIDTSSMTIEQEIERGKVNILTMHKAKGLTAKAVFVVAAEDEYLPGRAEGDAVGDERRLLYVSLTRAMHHLFITYCSRRTGQQRHTGRTSGAMRRTLTRFLADGPLSPVDGDAFVEHLERNDE